MNLNKIVFSINERKQNRKWNVWTKKKKLTMSWDGRVLGMKRTKKDNHPSQKEWHRVGMGTPLFINEKKNRKGNHGTNMKWLGVGME